ncbi:DUF2599 domain-containing protein [Mycobacterium spongiae]|uniref:DUF2599 domain-containing protein n=1 Tax=Mycobacterium spongiae TaxID=886343 RepID=A0A975JW51_9MYCO|nr:DUF2599 domain-containing protein [Mycobacterium spongiae]QUR66229.1 DUF2599 domain-containing protein [Mycobacterium spongiae]
MRVLLAVSTAVFVALLGAGPAGASPAADPGADADPPFVGHVEWTQWRSLTSLRIYPTTSGRTAAGHLGPRGAADEAWAEVLALAPDADSVGMHAQFMCHWNFAEIAQPGKASWNLEPWRPVVDDVAMITSACNPVGAEVRVPSTTDGQF